MVFLDNKIQNFYKILTYKKKNKIIFMMMKIMKLIFYFKNFKRKFCVKIFKV